MERVHVKIAMQEGLSDSSRKNDQKQAEKFSNYKVQL